MTMDGLMKFRTAYLRAIALSWVYPTFRDQLVSPPQGEDATTVMRSYLGVDWPWPNACKLKFKSKPDFQWICNEWVWPLNVTDHLKLHVPLDPKYTLMYGASSPSDPPIPIEFQALALADFYQQRSALFSDGWGERWGTSGATSGATDGGSAGVEPERSLEPEAGSGSPPPVGGFYPAASEFPAFQVALLAAIARAWEDKEFKRLLKTDAKTALYEIRGYKLPWKMTLSIKGDADARWNPPLSLEGVLPPEPSAHLARVRNLTRPDVTDGALPLVSPGWSFSKKNKLILNLPSRPKDLESEPIALAMYNGTGATYPFSCTC